MEDIRTMLNRVASGGFLWTGGSGTEKRAIFRGRL